MKSVDNEIIFFYSEVVGVWARLEDPSASNVSLYGLVSKFPNSNGKVSLAVVMAVGQNSTLVAK